MVFSRRQVMVAGIGAVAMPLAGCTGAQIANFQQQWSNFVDQVNGILSKGCGFLPGFVATANSIEAVVAVFFPSGAAAIAAGASAIAAVAGAICSTVPVVPPAALGARLRANTAAGVATFVGNTTINGRVVPIHGYSVR